jgi:KipI family sensor histidine kinase inhibitor
VTNDAVSILPFGEEAVLVTFGNRVDVALSRRVRRLEAAVVDAAERGIPFGVPVPAYASLLIPFNLERLDGEEARREVAALMGRLGVADGPEPPTAPGRLVEVPTRYGGEDGPDLADVADAAGLTPDQVVELHASRAYDVFMLGFAPGFAYLGVLPEAIVVPRRVTPRPRVPAGTVAIAEQQTAIYPVESPGGWNLIGRTDVRPWDAGRDPVALIAPGDRVRFVPVERHPPR